jgi:pimeloyl-ACP methyl ester carboxylesterase
MEHLFSSKRTLALDQRGHGRSTRRPHDLSREAFADDVAAVIMAAGIDRPVVLIGQSMGAHTALVIAARYPHLVTHLVMIEGDVGGGEGLASLRDALSSWPIPFPDYDSAMYFFGGDNELGRAWADGFEQRQDGLWPRWDLDVMVRTMAPIFEREYWAEWELLPHPTLLVLGQDSRIDPRRVEHMLAARPTTRRVMIAQAGHDVHLEQSRAWLRALDEFLG